MKNLMKVLESTLTVAVWGPPPAVPSADSTLRYLKSALKVLALFAVGTVVLYVLR